MNYNDPDQLLEAIASGVEVRNVYMWDDSVYYVNMTRIDIDDLAIYDLLMYQYVAEQERDHGEERYYTLTEKGKRYLELSTEQRSLFKALQDHRRTKFQELTVSYDEETLRQINAFLTRYAKQIKLVTI